MLGVGVGPWEIWDGNGKYDLKAWTLRFVADALFCVDDCCGLTDRHSSLDNHDITVKIILC